MDGADVSESLHEDVVVAELERAADELERAGSRVLEAELRVAFLDGVLEGLLTAIDAAVAAVDGHGDVAAVSPALCQAAGMRAARLVGRPFSLAAHDLGWHSVIAAVDEAVAGERAARVVTADGWLLKVHALPEGANGALVLGERTDP